MMYKMEKALLFCEVWSDFSVEVVHWDAFVAGDGEAPSLVGVEAEAAVDNDGVAAFGEKRMCSGWRSFGQGRRNGCLSNKIKLNETGPTKE